MPRCRVGMTRLLRVTSCGDEEGGDAFHAFTALERDGQHVPLTARTGYLPQYAPNVTSAGYPSPSHPAAGIKDAAIPPGTNLRSRPDMHDAR
jgi:hypothetical protein